MATLKERESLIKSLKVNDRTKLAGYKEDADSWLRNWRTERGLPADSGIIPNNRDEVPPYLRGWIFPKADATTTRDGMKIANFVAPSGTGKTLSDEWYDRGLETILESTEPGGVRDERLDILMHQYLDQVSNPQNDLKIAKTPSQQNATNMLKLIKKLEREGKYLDAKKLYDEQFPKA
tara:strand:- start:116 stop:649 length:534 start_codon:yes stop_codon:yes gene_type:complete